MAGQGQAQLLDVRALGLQLGGVVAEYKLDQVAGGDRQSQGQSLDHPDVADLDLAPLDLGYPAHGTLEDVSQTALIQPSLPTELLDSLAERFASTSHSRHRGLNPQRRQWPLTARQVDRQPGTCFARRGSVERAAVVRAPRRPRRPGRARRRPVPPVPSSCNPASPSTTAVPASSPGSAGASQSISPPPDRRRCSSRARSPMASSSTPVSRRTSCATPSRR